MKIKNYKDLLSVLAKLEGKKHQCSFGDLEELLAILSDLQYKSIKEDGESQIGFILWLNGERRAKKKKK